MALNSTVRWFHSDMADAPQINAQPGDLINILDACLVNGFGNKAIDSLVVADEVATVTISAGHLFEELAVIRINGATPAELNGDWRILTATGTAFTFAAPGIADVTATGTITCLRATPGHWEKAFSGEFKAAYRSTHPDATGFLLRIDDSATGTGSSPVRGYQSMTDIDTGALPFPTPAQLAALVWRRSNTTNSSALPRPWTLIADERWLWVFIDFSDAIYMATMYQFGDIVAANPYDATATVLTGHAASAPAVEYTSTAQNNLAPAVITGCYFAAPIVFHPEFVPPGYGRCGTALSGQPSSGEIFPATVNNGYLFHGPVMALSREGGVGRLRGVVPGLLQGLTEGPSTIGAKPNNKTAVRVILPRGAGHDRSLLLAGVMPPASPWDQYATVDIEGPWR